MKNKYTQEMENKNMNENSQEEKVLALCEKCDYCDEGTVFKRCLGCAKCFYEWHAGAWGYCYKCK